MAGQSYNIIFIRPLLIPHLTRNDLIICWFTQILPLREVKGRVKIQNFNTYRSTLVGYTRLASLKKDFSSRIPDAILGALLQLRARNKRQNVQWDFSDLNEA